MKKIEALVRHYKLEDVRDALTARGVHGMTVSEVHGFGRQMGRMGVYCEPDQDGDFVPKVKIEIAVADADSYGIIETIQQIAKTGHAGDGKIFVSNLQDVIRIRTGEVGEVAV